MLTCPLGPVAAAAEVRPALTNAFFLPTVPADYAKLEKYFATLKDGGANTVIIGPPAGGVPDADALPNIVYLAHAAGLRIYFSLPSRGWTDALREHPEWEDMRYDLNSGTLQGTGKLDLFHFKQPVLAMCGDSTFFHAAMPALVNAHYNQSNVVMVILDNSATAMTGFQPVPHAGAGARIAIEDVVRGLGVRFVEVADPYDVTAAVALLKRALAQAREERRPAVIVFRHACITKDRIQGEVKPRIDASCTNCGICYEKFECPALREDPAAERAAREAGLSFVKLEGNVALITGAAKGIGAAIADRLQAGAQLHAFAPRFEAGEQGNQVARALMRPFPDTAHIAHDNDAHRGIVRLIGFHQVEQPLRKLCQLNTSRSRTWGELSKFQEEKSIAPRLGAGSESPSRWKPQPRRASNWRWTSTMSPIVMVGKSRP